MAARGRRRVADHAIPTSGQLMRDFAVFAGFEDAARASLEFLHERLGFALWMVTRVEGDDWIVLNARDESYGVAAGDVFRWSDSLCSRMVQGHGPMFVADVNRVAVYKGAQFAQQLEIGAYIGTPICAADGSLFGTLCAIDPEPQSVDAVTEVPLVGLISTLLATVLSSELRLNEEHQRAERETLAANQDALTHVGTRRFWDAVMAAEEERCRIFGTRAAVLMIDLDGLKDVNDGEGHHAGDALLVAAAGAISASVRADDVVARVGGDEFAVLALDCTEPAAARLCERVRKTLAAVGVHASVGYSMRAPRATIDDAWRGADRHMYREKQERSRAA